MNGVISTKEESMIDRKPIITCGGELEVFSGLEDALTIALPQDSCEWRRSLGRPVKSVHIGVKFTPFSPIALPRENQWDLIRCPLFHIYWTECTDVDVYKSSVRDDIELWLKELNQRNITDWLVVVVETYDVKRTKNLLPRTTVLDKIRADFAPKQGDRCISVLSPSRHETRTADSWRGLVARVRHLVLVAYARAVTKLEDHIRQQRESRNEVGWDFIKYFQLQEELAQVLEMLGLYDESLVQYDELDALFSQFVVNSHMGDVAPWLSEFQKPLERWHGLRLGPAVLPNRPSLLELRSYLFAKQAHMLLLTCAPWEMASRCIPFLHTCVRELTLLEVTSPTGAVPCWVFLACLEVLHTCDRFNDSAQVEMYSLYTAGLWAYASQKLRELGELCGLLPGGSPTSEQLHIVVGLSAGMGDCPGTTAHPSPTDKLKEGLCSQDAFNKHYLELCELAMGTYKHIGRLRSARLVGRELASFYKLLGETQKAAAFLGDALKTFEQEGWRELAVQTQLELASCYAQAHDTRRYVRACAAVAAAPEMDTIIRCTYFDEMLKSLDALEKTLIVPFVNIFKIVQVQLKCEQRVVMQDLDLHVQLDLECSFPREVLCANLVIALECDKSVACKTKVEDAGDWLRCLSAKDLRPQPAVLQRLRIQRHLDYRQDKQIGSASVVCRCAPLKRADSSAVKLQRSDFSCCLKATTLPLVLTPGLNTIQLKWLAQPGKYVLSQVALELGYLEFLSPTLTPKLKVEVRREEPSLRLDKGSADDLLAGIEQIMLLTITVGSYPIESGSSIILRCSKGLMMQHDLKTALTYELEVPIDQTIPFSCTRLKLRVYAKLPAKEHIVTVQCPWTSNLLSVPLGFTSPLNVLHKLHTCKHRKFIQIIVVGQSTRRLQLNSIKLQSSDSWVKFKNLNPDIDDKSSVVSIGTKLSYMWELDYDLESAECRPLKIEFSTDYTALWGPEEKELDSTTRSYVHNFEIQNYDTLYILEAKVEPMKGSEFCRVGALCHLRLTIKYVNACDKDATRSLMYEILAEQNVWAVCGRTAGVVSLEHSLGSQSITLDVMPLTNGFLPLPSIRLSKYIPADKSTNDPNRKSEASSHPRLEPFSPGQVHNTSKAQQVHVLVSINEAHAP